MFWVEKRVERGLGLEFLNVFLSFGGWFVVVYLVELFFLVVCGGLVGFKWVLAVAFVVFVCCFVVVL